MKRSPIKPRSKPMRRKLSFSDVVRRALAYKRDVPLNAKRKPLPRIGPRARRDQYDIAAFRERLMERAAGYCERCGTRQMALECHHLVRRARCVGWPDRHNPEVNGLAVCYACHRSLDLDPMDVGGPAEWAAKRAHAAFEEWRRDRSILSGERTYEPRS